MATKTFVYKLSENAFYIFFWGWNLYIKVKLMGFASNITPFMETTQPVFSWADESFFAKPVEMLTREWNFWDILHVLTETFLRDENVDPVGLDARVCCVQWGEDFVAHELSDDLLLACSRPLS